MDGTKKDYEKAINSLTGELETDKLILKAYFPSLQTAILDVFYVMLNDYTGASRKIEDRKQTCEENHKNDGKLIKKADFDKNADGWFGRKWKWAVVFLTIISVLGGTIYKNNNDREDRRFNSVMSELKDVKSLLIDFQEHKTRQEEKNKRYDEMINVIQNGG